MKNKSITLGSVSITDLERGYVNQVLDSTLVGPFEFSKKVSTTIAQLHGFKYGRYLNSGQSALTIALRALIKQKKWNHKPVVATPAVTYISTQASCIFAGCDFVLVDVGFDDINMDPDHLRKVIEHQNEIGHPVDIVMPVHLCGKPVKPEIKQICDEFNLPTVVDSCETIFAPHGLDWGDIVCFSTFSNHTIGAGAGGVVVTNNSQLDFLMFQQISHGRENENPGLDPMSMGERFRFSEWGESLKPSDLYAAVALGAVERRDTIIHRQRENAILLTSILEGLPLLLPNEDNHTFMFYPIICKESVNVGRLLSYLHSKGIFTRRLMPITNQEVVLNYMAETWLINSADLNKQYPNARFINTNGFYVGSHPGLSLEDINYLGQQIRSGI